MKVLASLLLVFSTASPVVFAAPRRQQPAAQQAARLEEADRQHAAAVRLSREGKSEEALAAARHALELREKALGEDHYLVRVSLTNLALLHAGKRDFAGALRAYRRLLALYDKAAKPDAEHVARVLEGLGAAAYYENNSGEAERAYRRLVELRESAHGADHPLVARSLFLAASFHQFKGDNDRAKRHYARAISIWERGAEGHKAEYAFALERHACFLRKDGRDDEAEAFERRGGDLLAELLEEAQKSGRHADVGVEGGVLNGQAVSKPAPVYPEEAKNQRQQGTVVVRILVDEAGYVRHACALSGPRTLREASERAAYAARFTPTLLSGQPVKVTGTITYNYNLR